MKNKELQKEKWYMELKAKDMVDYEGNYVEMISVGKDGKEFLHWSDGAVTVRGFKRDRLFNNLFKIIRFWKINKFLIRLTIIFLVIILLSYGIKFLISLF